MKTLISTGGWTDSNDKTNNYSKLVSRSAKIATFVSSVIKFLQTYGFDGFDLDWEFPETDADKAGFAVLFQALRNAFDSKGYPYLLCAAMRAIVNDSNDGKL